MAQMLALGFDCWVEKSYYRRKTPLGVGGTQTQVLADSIAIAASALNHCANYCLAILVQNLHVGRNIALDLIYMYVITT